MNGFTAIPSLPPRSLLGVVSYPATFLSSRSPPPPLSNLSVLFLGPTPLSYSSENDKEGGEEERLEQRAQPNPKEKKGGEIAGIAGKKRGGGDAHRPLFPPSKIEKV